MKRPIGLIASIVVLALAANADGANHREAPITALDHKADIADFFAFVSYDDPSKVTLILDVDPLLEPSNGPTQFPFDPNILYTIRVDNDHDAIRDVAFQFQFQTEIRLPGVFQGLVGVGNGLDSPDNSPAPVPPGVPIIPPAITALDGPGSEGFNLRQTYTVTLLRDGQAGARRTVLSEGQTLYAVPSNVGPRTMPNYPELADQGIYDLGGGVRVFAGTVEDPFWIDLGAAFDTFNLRTQAFETGVAGVLSDAQDANDVDNFAADDVSGFNVNAIAIEVPITMLTSDGTMPPANDPKATIGAYGATLRPRMSERTVVPVGSRGSRLRVRRVGNANVQVQRMGNPLFNELLIGVGSKDKFSMSLPRDDAQFSDFALDPVLARVLNAAYEATVGPGILPVPDAPRTDLLPLVQYMPPIAADGTPRGPVADLLRLNTGVPPTAAQDRSRLGLLGGDGAGFPNGRRVSDDVTDITTRAVLGVLNPAFNVFPNNRVGDGVNANDANYRETFPYVGYAHSGVESRHVDPGEPGCTGTCP